MSNYPYINMAKGDKIPVQLRIPKRKYSGNIRKRIGKEKLLDGSVREMAFYLGTNVDTARQKLERLSIEWGKLQAAGYQWWTDEVLQQLQAEGVIKKHRLKTHIATNLIGTPLNAADLKPYVDEATGLIKPEFAPQVIDHGTRKVFGRFDVQCRFFEDLYSQAIKDPLSTFERCSRLFGWSSQQTQSFLFNINNGSGTGTASQPIAFDASESITTTTTIDNNSNNNSNNNPGENAEPTATDSNPG